MLVGSAVAASAVGCGAEPIASEKEPSFSDKAPLAEESNETSASHDGSGNLAQATGPAATAPTSTNGQKFGDWTYVEVAGAQCRDGSPAGYYIRKGTSKNLMIFLNGGGVCYDDFFCSINPKNVTTSLPGETLISAVVNIGSGVLSPQRQVPPNAGIFKKDARNPVSEWNMVFVPYCTGDVYGGTKRDAKVPGTTLPPQQFVGYHNVGLFLEHFGPEFKGSAEQVLLTSHFT